MQSQSFRFQLPDIHPTEVPFIQDKFSDGIIPPIIRQSEKVKAFSQDINPVSVSMSSVIVYKAPFTISSYAFQTPEWSNLAKDNALRLRRTLLLVTFLVGFVDGKLKRLEEGHRKNNILIFGLEERTDFDRLDVVMEFLRETMGHEVLNGSIDYVARLGKRRGEINH
jgi:hypothetical protein